MITAVLPVLAAHRVYVRPVFGIIMNPTTQKEAEFFNEAKGMPAGEYIAKVYEGGLAAKAGIKAGDVLYELDGMPVDNRGQMFLKSIQTYVTLTGYLERTPLGSLIKMKLWRKGKAREVKVPYQIIPHRAVPNVVEAALHKQPYLIKGGLVITPMTQNFIKLMTNPVVLPGGQEAKIPVPDLLKYAKYPDDRKGPRLVVADVISSSVAEATKVFSEGMVIDKVNGKKVRTMGELCAVVDTPAKDSKGQAWLTVEDEDGNMGAMLVADIAKDDKKLVAQNLYTTKATVCNSKTDGKKAKEEAKKKTAKEGDKTNAASKKEEGEKKVAPEKKQKEEKNKPDHAVNKQTHEKGSFMESVSKAMTKHPKKVVTMPGETLRVLEGKPPEARRFPCRVTRPT